MLFEVVCPDYPTKIKLSNKRRPKYYKANSKKELPKKYQDKSKYDFKKSVKNKLVSDINLWDLNTNKKVIANPRSVGTPRYQQINGQYLYSGFSSPFTRNKIVTALHEYFMERIFKSGIKPVKIEKFPLLCKVGLYTFIGKADWDLSNLWIYYKTFEDCLVKSKIIPDDSILYITGAGACTLVPIKEDNPNHIKKIIFRYYEDKRLVISEIKKINLK